MSPARRMAVADLRSQRWFARNDLRSFGHRSRAKQEGFADEDFRDKPVIAILNTWSEANPCHAHFRLRAEGSWEYQPFGRSELLWRSSASEPEADAYQGRLAVLVDAGCLSACEDFVMPFKDNGRALVVGETTGGSTGQPYMLDLGDGMQAIVGAKREMFPDGSPFEGIGIRPDVEAPPKVDDLRAGHDVALEAARQRLLEAGTPAQGRR